MRRLIATALSLIASAGFISCSGSAPELYDMALGAKLSEVEAVELSYYEGCYSNGEYGLEIICAEKKADSCVYDFILFNMEDGEQQLFGTCEGIFEHGKIFRASDVKDEKNEIVAVVAEDFSVDVTYICGGTEVACASGNYTYCGNEVEISAEKAALVSKGEYRNGEYKLTVSENGGVTRTYITDADGLIVFEASKIGGTQRSSYMVTYNGTTVEIGAAVIEGREAIEIAEYSGKRNVPYSGVYYRIEN